MAIDISKVFEASPSVRIELFASINTVKVRFARDIDLDILADLRNLKSYGVSVYESSNGRTIDLFSGILNLPALAEQTALGLERDHGVQVERVNLSARDRNQVVESFTGAES
jgi:hypothetical protein